MNYPRFVFKVPGPIARAGGTYDQVLANDSAELEAKKADGWFESMLDAIDPPKPIEKVDDAPPTRAELEAKAKELGLTFDGRTSDAKLGKMIADKLAG